MTEPFYAPHQLAELQEGYYAVNRTYEQLLGEYLSLRLTSEAAYEYARHGFVRRLGRLKRCTGTSTGRLMIAVLGGFGGRGARPDPYPHRRGPQPGAKAVAAHGPTAEIDPGATGRGPPPTGAGRNACRIRAQLRRRKEYDFKAHGVKPPRTHGQRSDQNESSRGVTATAARHPRLADL
jgi:hypothetical protein